MEPNVNLDVVTFNNKTLVPLEMTMFVVADLTIGGSSVVWQQTIVPPNGPGVLQWSRSHDVAIAHEQDDILTPFQITPAAPASTWRIEIQNGTQTLVGAGSARPDQIVIRNESGLLANAGIGLSGSAAFYQRDLPSNAQALFVLGTMSYWLIVTVGAKKGELISKTTKLAGPLAIRLRGDVHAAVVTAVATPEGLQLEVQYGGVPAPPAS